jgi:hypothetical protein
LPGRETVDFDDLIEEAYEYGNYGELREDDPDEDDSSG